MKWDATETLKFIFFALLAIVVLLIFVLCGVLQLHGSTECHITSLTTQMCEYR